MAFEFQQPRLMLSHLLAVAWVANRSVGPQRKRFDLACVVPSARCHGYPRLPGRMRRVVQTRALSVDARAAKWRAPCFVTRLQVASVSPHRNAPPFCHTPQGRKIVGSPRALHSQKTKPRQYTSESPPIRNGEGTTPPATVRRDTQQPSTTPAGRGASPTTPLRPTPPVPPSTRHPHTPP